MFVDSENEVSFASVSAFLDLRPDDYGIHQKSMAKKGERYFPVLEFFNSLQECQGWTLLQVNFAQ